MDALTLLLPHGERLIPPIILLFEIVSRLAVETTTPSKIVLFVTVAELPACKLPETVLLDATTEPDTSKLPETMLFETEAEPLTVKLPEIVLFETTPKPES